jgi:hypothetical protein
MNLEIRNTRTATLHGSVHPEYSKQSVGLRIEKIWVHSIVLYSYTYDIYITIFKKDNQYYASQYQQSTTAKLLICWQCILRETGKTSQAFVHLPLNFTEDGIALVSASRKTDQRTYMQYVVLPQHMAFSRVINVWRILYNSRSTIHSTHNWIIDVTGVTQKQDYRKRVTTFVL